MAKKNNELDLSDIREALAEIKLTLKYQAEQLQEHIKRTNLIEERLLPLNAVKDRVLGAGMALATLGSSVLLGKVLYSLITR
jgi:hypothetical protein